MSSSEPKTLFNDDLIMHKHGKYPDGTNRAPEMTMYSCLADNRAMLAMLSNTANEAMDWVGHIGSTSTQEQVEKLSDLLTVMRVLLSDASNDMEGMGEMVLHLDRYRQSDSEESSV